jgi:hypothetical protein
MSFIAENDSLNYYGLIQNDITIPDWGRRIYDILANKNIRITMPLEPFISNSIESGSVHFRRLDTDSSFSVIVQVEIRGSMVDIPIYVDPWRVHKFRSIFDSTGSTVDITDYEVSLLNIGYGSERVQRLPVDTVSLVNQNINANNYIGLVINGFTLANGSSLLLASQTDATENGVYSVNSSGHIFRRSQESLGFDGKYYTFPVTRGNTAGAVYQITNATNPDAPAIFGESPLTVAFYTRSAPALIEDKGIHTAKIIASSYTALSTDYRIHVNSTAGPITITLPPASSYTSPQVKSYQIFKTDTSNNTITIQASGTDTLSSGGNSFQFYMPYQQVDLTSDSLFNIFYIS